MDVAFDRQALVFLQHWTIEWLGLVPTIIIIAVIEAVLNVKNEFLYLMKMSAANCIRCQIELLAYLKLGKHLCIKNTVPNQEIRLRYLTFLFSFLEYLCL